MPKACGAPIAAVPGMAQKPRYFLIVTDSPACGGRAARLPYWISCMVSPSAVTRLRTSLSITRRSLQRKLASSLIGQKVLVRANDVTSEFSWERKRWHGTGGLGKPTRTLRTLRIVRRPWLKNLAVPNDSQWLCKCWAGRAADTWPSLAMDPDRSRGTCAGPSS